MHSPPPPSPSFTDDNEIVWTDVVYSPDGKSLTLYLEGGVPVTKGQMRGLSRELAIAGHDYFEVVFHYRAADSANDVIARTSWELYRDARITGVRGKGGEGDTNYGYTAVYGAGSNVAPTTGTSGAAILFVGKKTDRTLLAVGRLASTKLIGGADGPATSISVNTASVTFNVSALKSGINVAGSGFYTDYSYSGTRNPDEGNVYTLTDTGDAPNTTLKTSFTINGKGFPMYKLLQGSTKTHAQYHFALEGGLFSSYQNGIILAGEGSYGKKQPRYPTTNGQFQYASLRLDSNTIIEPVVNNIVPAGYNPAVTPYDFKNIIRVSFDTHNVTAQGSAFAFVFEIPVYALTALKDPVTWYIRPSYDSYFLDLDDGTGAAGGAVLLGIGNPEENSDFKIRVVVPPIKWKYNNQANSYNGGRGFNIDGLVVWMENATTSTPIRELYIYTELTYELGMKRIIHNTTVGSFGESLKESLYSMQTIIVKYTDPGSGATRTSSFYIICDNDTYPTRYTDIPESHYLRVSSDADVSNIASYTSSAGRGTYVLVLTANYDMTNFVIQSGASPSLFIIVAGNPTNAAVNPNRRVGRSGDGGRITVAATDSGFYFGKWPFYDQLVVSYASNGTTPITPITFHFSETISGQGKVPDVTYQYATHGYTLNVDGPIAQITVDGTDANNNGYAHRFIHTNIGGVENRLYNVTVDKYVNIVPAETKQLF